MELLAAYSIEQIIIFCIGIAIAGKKLLELIDYYKNKGKQVYEEQSHIEVSLAQIATLAESIDKINKRLDLLTESDKDDIRSWIVEKYNYYKANPDEKIDSYIMDTIERRFNHYQAEGGNSYISSIVEELREKYKEE